MGQNISPSTNIYYRSYVVYITCIGKGLHYLPVYAIQYTCCTNINTFKYWNI